MSGTAVDLDVGERTGLSGTNDQSSARLLSGADRASSIEDLVEFVIDETESPVDAWAVAATLESRGLRDVDAEEVYSAEGIFGLADEVYAAVRANLSARANDSTSASTIQIRARVWRFTRLYVKGMFFALPMAIQIVSVLALGYALWAYLRFDEAQATTVAVGTTLSFVVTGGFVQAIGRLGLYYSEQGAHILSRQIQEQLIRRGMITALVVACAWFVVNLWTGHFPAGTVAVALMYFLLLSALWLFMAVLYTTQRRLGIVLAPTIGVAVIALVFSWGPLGIFVSHWVGLAASCAVAWWWGRRVLIRRTRGSDAGDDLAVLPRPAILAYVVAPYFAYGILYFGFLFLDRMVAWSTAQQALPFLIWFRTPYELGLDWALLSLVFTIALLEYTIHSFSELIIPTQERFAAASVVEHNRFFIRFYVRQLIALLVLSVASGFVVYRAVLWTRRFDDLRQVRDFFASEVTVYVFVIGVVGYSLLVLALMNGVFFFALSRPWFVLKPIAAGLITSAVVGFALSRMGQYWLASVGMAAGAAVFAILTTRHAWRVLHDLDYYYYSAY